MSLSAISRLRSAIGPRVVVALSMPRGARSMARSIWRLRGWDPAQHVVLSVPAPDRVPVIFCVWRRLERLPVTLEMLAAQDMPVTALIWDNSGQPETVDKAVADAPLPVAVHHSSRNIGGFGRFYLARAAADAGHEAVLFIDDDEDFGPAAIRQLLSAHKPRSASSGWAFRFTGKHYYSREQCAPGEAAHYLGTGAMVADPAVFADPRLFSCPRRYWFVEDLWLCFVAQHLNGYALSASPASFREVLDGRNQWPMLWWAKDRLLRYALRRGWLQSRA